MAVIDFHCHILPRIDDGSKNVEMSMEMLQMASLQGVDVMLATPHFYGSRHRVEEFLDHRDAAFKRLSERKGDFGPVLKPGAEVAFFPGISQADRIDDLTVAGTRVLLLEMPFTPWSGKYVSEVRELITVRGFQVVLAHLERYMNMNDNKKYLDELMNLPLHVQVNAESLLDFRSRRRVLKLFSDEKANFLGTDCHRTDKRKPNLGEGREVIRKKLGEGVLKRIDDEGCRLLKIGG